MNNNSDEQLLITQATIEANRKENDEKMNNLTEDLTEMITSMTDHIKIYKYSPDQKYSPNIQDPTTAVLDNNRAPLLEGGYCT